MHTKFEDDTPVPGRTECSGRPESPLMSWALRLHYSDVCLELSRIASKGWHFIDPKLFAELDFESWAESHKNRPERIDLRRYSVFDDYLQVSISTDEEKLWSQNLSYDTLASEQRQLSFEGKLVRFLLREQSKNTLILPLLSTVVPEMWTVNLCWLFCLTSLCVGPLPSFPP